jgi:hypothetical protein
MNRTCCISVALALLVPATLPAQRLAPPAAVLGRTVTLAPVGRGADVRGELLAASFDSVWVLEPMAPKVVAVSIKDIREARVQRHSMTPAKGFLWGITVGAIAGAGLSIACSQVSDGCGSVFVGSLAAGALYGGLAAISFASSSRWRIEPVTPERLAPYARFPQGPPAGLDLARLARPDSMPPAAVTQP